MGPSAGAPTDTVGKVRCRAFGLPCDGPNRTAGALAACLDGARVLGARTAVPLLPPPDRPILSPMTDVAVLRRGRFPIRVLVASPLALLLVVLAVGSATGHSDGRLADPAVSPSVAVAEVALNTITSPKATSASVVSTVSWNSSCIFDARDGAGRELGARVGGGASRIGASPRRDAERAGRGAGCARRGARCGAAPRTAVVC